MEGMTVDAWLMFGMAMVLLALLLWSLWQLSQGNKRIEELEKALGIEPRKFYKKIGQKWVRTPKEE